MRTSFVVTALFLLALPFTAAAQPAADRQAALEKKFEQLLTNAALVGSFTLNDRKNDGKLNQERYVITKVEKLDGDQWTFFARIQYGKHDVTLPLTLQVKWAGDTPVITVNKFKVPGMGTYSARVMLFNDQYSGIWDAGDHGGQLFGRVEKVPALETCEIGKVKTFRFGDVYLAGQPSEEELAKFKTAGVKQVINLRLEGENKAYDEKKVIEGLGMVYHNPAFNSAATLTPEIFAQVRKLLSKKDGAVLLHCASANRVGAIWLAHRVLDDKVSYEQALEEAKKVGMNAETYEATVKAYIERERGK